jgi:murein L,D-transpeptidase YafK
VPSQFLALSTRSRYAIAVDASRSRLYLFENTDKGLKLTADYYISVGKSGTDKLTEGDARTPLGVYYITSSLDPKSLKDFYGAGALPINYPNPYDVRRGRTGGGIWLHGTPPQQFARAPLASDGCVVMANPDLKQLLRKVQIGATPVVTARSLQWISPPQAEKEAQSFTSAINAWKEARASGNEAQLKKFYLPDFQRNSKKSTEGISAVDDEVEIRPGQARAVQGPVVPALARRRRHHGRYLRRGIRRREERALAAPVLAAPRQRVEALPRRNPGLKP